ncbi:MAG: formylglycine-generating enzyme family protein [Draconibacterium sp.]
MAHQKIFKVLLILFSITCVSCATLLRQTNGYSETIGDINIDMVMVKGGAFVMGCNNEKQDCKDDALPLHKVVLNSFYISKYEITYEQYDIFCEHTGHEKPLDFDWGRDNRPVAYVNWHDAMAFCKWLSEISGQIYRLPTEAEWEYAAKGGVNSKGYIYAGSNNVDKVAWVFRDDYSQQDSLAYMKTQPVGRKKSNELGLYDMSGNVWEWCNDSYSPDFYKKSSLQNPLNAKSLAKKVVRGGGWESLVKYSLITNRDSDYASVKDFDLGFRIIKEIQENEEK